ncbi:NADH dehydrogenase subunit M [Thalassoporum mexicanum PCC 7367]|uniref:NADH-quinone oxidoreductase subunit M n=1 Tax=Thalassoporum mexicanum TaxID=3457544 RepID=UPI00029FF914|nr:NADH-quinone oxidoreductase subunit M [Pseudanabaena sp. PCC 7367]AFY69876.1 NADH dehydrogenase subunit M [Pseudanabaena sp. PCC 7367]
MLNFGIWWPVLGALVICLWPIEMDGKRLRQVALAFAIAAGVWSLVLASQFALDNTGMQFEFYLPWIEPLGLSYSLGVDGISLPLVVLNTVLTAIAIYSSAEKRDRPRFYYALLLILSGAVTGAFLVQNFLLFFLFYELELIPLYLLIAIWGGQKRGYAATKFLIYTAISGALVLASCFGLAWLSNSFNFDYANLANNVLPIGQQVILLVLLLVGFGIKIPLVPLHTWLPDAHVEASTPISVLLAGVLLKLGTYGILRFGLGLFPDAWQLLGPWLAIWAVISVLYGSFNAIAQTDMKKMVAYSSIGHMGFVLLALAAATPLSTVAAIMQMVTHGLISAMLFLLVGVVYAKTGTRDINVLKGLLNPERGLPIIGSLMIIGVMASAGTPGMAGFISEFVVFRSSFAVFPAQTLLSMLGTALTAVYFLLLVNRAFFGRLAPEVQHLPRVDWHDRIPAIVLAVLVVVFGVLPNWLTRWSETSAIAMFPAHDGKSMALIDRSQQALNPAATSLALELPALESPAP